ncbi:MAG: hypothetical protein IJQ29_07380, partial [Synergistaceae bacterium]|nr:hypothetical protein [Synergistaceae bacterium]
MKRISTGLLYAFAAAMILLLAAGAPALAAAKIIYVDSSGNETSGTGEKDAPFKTIEDAFDYAKTNKSTLGDEVTIEVAKGTYTLTKQILVNQDYPSITLNLEAETTITADSTVNATTETITDLSNNKSNIAQKRLFLVDADGKLTVNGQGSAEIKYGKENMGCFMVIQDGILTVNNISLKYDFSGNMDNEGYDDYAVV